MSEILDVITPVPRSPNDHAASAVHGHLRSLILIGVLPPGSILNQVELAPRLGVSRTPLREAIRMLQEEGLVEQEPQKRARVIGFDPADLETAYVQRILLEGLAVSLTVAAAGDEEVSELEGLLAKMKELAEAGDLESWHVCHGRFHAALVSGVENPQFARIVRSNMERSEHYRILSQASRPRGWSVANAEHEAIVNAFIARDGRLAASRLGSHLAMTALGLIAQLAPTFDPAALRAATAVVGTDSIATATAESAKKSR